MKRNHKLSSTTIDFVNELLTEEENYKQTEHKIGLYIEDKLSALELAEFFWDSYIDWKERKKEK